MLKKNMKKALALLSSLLILCSLVPLSALFMANADSANLLTNGGFEDDEAGWSFNSGSHAIVSDAHEGSKALSLTNPGMWGEGAITTIAVSPDTDYTITWWCKASAGTGTFNLYVMNGATFANMTSKGGQNWMNGFNGNWQQKSYTVNSGSANSMMLKFSTEAANPGTVLLDDISVTKVGGSTPPPIGGDSLMANGDFETGSLDGWAPCQGTVISADAKKNGSYGANLKGDGSWGGLLDQNLTVVAGKKYTLTFWYKAKTGGANFVVKENGTSLASHWGNKKDWTQVTLEFTPTGTNLLLNICGGGDGVPADVYVDDFVLTVEGGSTPPPIGGDSLIANGDFELGDLTGWTPCQGTVISADAKKNGSYGANLKGDGGWGGLLDQNLTVVAGKKYTLTFWYKAKTGGANFVVKENGTSLASHWGNKKDWTQVTLEFTPTGTELLLNICGGGDSVPADVYVDDFVLTVEGGSTPPPIGGDSLIANGDFELGDLTGWSPFQNTVISADAKKNGSYGANLKGDGGWGGLLDQNLTVVAGKTYTLSFWYKANTGGANFVVKENGTGIASYWGNAKSWTQFTLEFTPTGTELLLNICGGGDGVPADLYVDDFVLSVKGGSEPPASTGLQNGDFELGDLTGWSPFQNTVISADAKKNGSYGANLKGDGGWGGLLDQNLTVVAGKTYTLSFWYKANTGGANFVVKENGTGIASYWGNAKSWTQQTLEFTPTGTELLLNICGGGDGVPADLYVDDFVLSVKGDVPDTTEFLNGDFELGDLTGWTPWQSTAISADAKKNGSYGANLKGDGGWGGLLDKTFNVEAGKTYVLTFWHKANSGGANFVVKENGAGIASYWGNSSSWTQQTLEFTPTGTELLLNICGGGDGVPSDLYVDDFVLALKGDGPDVPDDPIDPTANQIKNGGFEDGEEGWTWNGKTTLATGDSFTGENSARLEHNSAYGEALTQVVKVLPNTDYVMIWYSRRISGSGAWDAFLMDYDTINAGNKNIDVTSGNKWFSQTSKEWVENRITFNTGDAKNLYVKFGPETENSGIFLLDEVALYVKGNEPSGPIVPPEPPKTSMYMTSFGVLNNRPSEGATNLVLNPSFEEGNIQWPEDVPEGVLTVVDDETTMDGKKSLFFNTAGIEEETKLIYWIDVEPNTTYTFSTWIKGAFLASDNRGLATIGIVGDDGTYLADYVENDIKRFLNGERQIVPTAWDNEWHIRGIEFNTGDATKVGIAMAGTNSQMWVDDLALFKSSDGQKYLSPQNMASINLAYDLEDVTCKDKDSLIPDPTFSKDLNDFWKDSYGWRNGFLSYADNEYEYGTSLKYTATADNAPLSIIKTIPVKPNTDYIFAVDLKVIEDGWGRLILCDGKKREPITFLTIDFDSNAYDEENSYYGWYTVACKFNTDAFEKISLAVVDDGGVALMDNMRLFEASDADGSVKDKFIVPPQEPEDSDDYYGEDYFDNYYEDVIPEEPIVNPTQPVPPVTNNAQDNGFWSLLKYYLTYYLNLFGLEELVPYLGYIDYLAYYVDYYVNLFGLNTLLAAGAGVLIGLALLGLGTGAAVVIGFTLFLILIIVIILIVVKKKKKKAKA